MTVLSALITNSAVTDSTGVKQSSTIVVQQPMQNQPQQSLADWEFRNKFFQIPVAIICKESGFESIQAGAHGLLSKLLSNFFDELCRGTKDVCENAGRCVATPSDVCIGLANRGFDIDSFLRYLQKLPSVHQPRTLECLPSPLPKVPSTLRIADPHPLPSYFPNFLPPFPDPHTYIKTDVSSEFDSSYSRVRYLQAKNKRDMERNLINYALAVYPTVSLFQEYERTLTADDMKRRVPQILLPFSDKKPYVSSLLTDDVDLDEDPNYFASILKKEMEDDLMDIDENVTIENDCGEINNNTFENDDQR